MKLPFAVTEHRNASGTISYRVTGRWKGERTRKNFAEHGHAEAGAARLDLAALGDTAPVASLRVAQTRLGEDDVRAAEAALDRIAGRWPLRAVLAAGIAQLEAVPESRPVAPLAKEWLALIEAEVSARWLADLRHRVGMFVRAHPELNTDQLTRAVVRSWLDGLPHAQQSKANMRNAVHRFGGWLVERGHVRENPAADIRITRRRSGALADERELPAVLSAKQAEALMRACELGACRRLLGSMAACLFTGIRPDSEAPRATWAEVDLAAGEWSVMGRKRGAKPRVMRLHPTAVAWLRVAEADKIERPGLFSRRFRVRAVELANEWLAESAPTEPRIVWSEDITRHTFASYRSHDLNVQELAAQMGNSPSTIYAHYRHPRKAAEVAAFWSITPSA